MKTINTLIILMFNLIAVTVAYAEGMCKSGEKAIFNCELSKSTSSLCQSMDSGALTYRNGVDGKIRFELSNHDVENGPVFYFSNIPYAGGGEAHIRFSSQEYTYYLYDKTVKTDEGPTFSAGIVIYKKQNKISNLVCSNDASIHESAYQSITKEPYRPIAAK
ncbi:hypothetical protein [Paraburkholderia sp. HP33-1]|uniref:hypothetical protein n=1 Tax=Paraburkholderia sp. HP33-1 TaxID=2883243 RepID=UPI001F4103A8|nr:hypothetical protein [Paraburkholderia sp. HP33-1]